MSLVPFLDLPDHARLWVFPSDRSLTSEEQAQVVTSVEAGLHEWVAHGSPVHWGHQIVHDQFLMIGVDESHTALTGCSIDSAVGRIKKLERDLGLSLLDNSRVFYREQGLVHGVTRSEFKDRIRTGEVTRETPVFDNVIEKVGEYRKGLWEIPLAEAWHARAFSLPQ